VKALQNATGSNPSSSDVEADLVSMLDDLEGSDVDMTNPAWFMSSRTKNYLINLRDGNGNLVYPTISEGAMPSLYGYPVYVSTNVPNNINSNESEIYFVNMNDTMIAETGGMEITADSTASYMEGSNLVSAFSRDQTVIRAIVRHDFGVAYPEAISCRTGVTWSS